jgi:UDP-N-acetylglucosamine 2-epimerase
MIFDKLGSHLKSTSPDYIIVPGDTTSAFGAAMVGFKMEIPVCHLESGLRRYDYRYQEEMNRRLIDHGSAGLFAPTQTAVDNLKLEDVLGRVYLIGDTMYDILKDRLSRYTDEEFRNKVLSSMNFSSDEYSLLTLHRRENVDSKENLTNIISAINKLDFPIIFPIHPRTKAQLEAFSIEIDTSHIQLINPLAYDEFMSLVASSKLVISDSGGIQKECYLLNVPLVSLHQRTEWVETFEAGSNRLTPLEQSAIIANCQEMYGKKLSNDPSVYGDGNAARKIPPILESGEISMPTDRLRDPFASYF